MSGDLLIRGGRLLDPATGRDEPGDLLLRGGVIARLGPPGSASDAGAYAEVIDASGLWVTPGLIDMHVHLREPGEEYKEDIASGSRAAVAGGFAAIAAMPNTQPDIDGPELVRFVRERGEEIGLCRVLAIGALTVGQQGKTLAPMAQMRHAGAVAVSDDGGVRCDAALMRRAIEYAHDHALVVLSHAEDGSLAAGGQMHEGVLSTRLGLRGVPAVAETLAVGRDIELAALTGGRLHLCHLSTAGAVELVRRAKERGGAVTAEVTPHHLTLTDEAARDYDTNAKMRPPLRSESDRQALIAGLVDGTIDAIATDHAPHSVLEKDVPFEEAKNGIVGLQTALPLALALYHAGTLAPLPLIERLTVGPARALGLGPGWPR